MRALVTRPREDAAPVAAELRALGVEAVVEPMLDIEPTPAAAIDLEGVQAILLTSRNGVRALASATARRDVPVYAVGDSTAGLARDAGFAAVVSAAGDGESLAGLVAARLDPAAGPLCHGVGAHVAGDLAARLARRGFAVRRQVLYAARAATALSAELRGMLSAGELDLALFFSPRTARTFASLLRRAGIAASCRAADAICLSAAVAGALAGIVWRAVHVADRPDMAALLACVSRSISEREANS